MPKKDIIEFKNKNYEFDSIEVMRLGYFDNSKKTSGELVERLDEKLLTTEQKNSIRIIIDTLIDSKNKLDSLYFTDILGECQSFLNGYQNEKRFFLSIAEKGDAFKKRLKPTDVNYDEAIKIVDKVSRYAYGLINTDRERADYTTKYPKQAAEDASAEHQKEETATEQRVVKDKNADAIFSELPDLSNKDAADWILNLKVKAKAAKGRFKDSAQYKTFYDNVKVTTELATKLLVAKNKKLNELPLISFDAITRDLLSDKAVNGQISMKVLREAYEKSWINVQNSATNCEKNKYDDKNSNKKSDCTLDKSSRKKLAIIDEIMGRVERKAAKFKNILM